MRAVSVLALALVGCSDFTYSRPLKGEVVQAGSRLKATETGEQQKISLLLQVQNPDPKIQEVACGPSGCVVECLSTRCASLLIGTCHRFECRYSYRLWEPDVIACKHAKEIVCPD